jgi:hypothetical protein
MTSLRFSLVCCRKSQRARGVSPIRRHLGNPAPGRSIGETGKKLDSREYKKDDPSLFLSRAPVGLCLDAERRIISDHPHGSRLKMTVPPVPYRRPRPATIFNRWKDGEADSNAAPKTSA